MVIVKNLMEKPSFFMMDWYYVINIFDLHTFDNETKTILNFYEISTEMDFVYSF